MDNFQSNSTPKIKQTGIYEGGLNLGIQNKDLMVTKGYGGAGHINENLDLILEEENSTILSVEGKKRQRVSIVAENNFSNEIFNGSHDITASFAGQSSRSQ